MHLSVSYKKKRQCLHCGKGAAVFDSGRVLFVLLNDINGFYKNINRLKDSLCVGFYVFERYIVVAQNDQPFDHVS